jgi:hypothetical protein
MDRVLTSHAFNASHGVTRLQYGAVPPVREVERLLPLPRVDDGVIARHEGVTLDNPDKLLARVVEVQLELVAGEVMDSPPVNWRVSMRYSWETWANLRRSSVSR